MDLIFAISGHRGISESEVVNSYTYRQAIDLCAYLAKDKFLVVSELLSAFSGSSKGSSKKSGSRSTVPKWFKQRAGKRYNVIDLDGPMENIEPYVGMLPKPKKK